MANCEIRAAVGIMFFFSSGRRHTRCSRDWSSDVCSSDLLYPLLSPALWRQSGRFRDPEELCRMRLLHDRDPNTSWQVWRQKYGPAALDVRRGPRFASSDLLLRAAAQGLGVALARHRLAQEDLASGPLVRPFETRVIDLCAAHWIVRPRGGAPREAVTILLAWLRRGGQGAPLAARSA